MNIWIYFLVFTTIRCQISTGDNYKILFYLL